MKAENEFNHFCEEQTYFVLYTLKDKTTKRYEVPYETTYLLDSVQVDNQIYFTGGGVPPNESGKEEFFQTAMRLTVHEEEDPTVEKLANMNVSRANHTMAALNASLIFVIGGCNTKAEIPSCEQYKVSTKKWDAIASLNEKKMWVSVCTFQQKFLYAFGGSTKMKPAESETIEFLDTTNAAAKTWSLVSLASGKELWKRCFWAGSMQIDPETILVFGGLANKAEIEDVYMFTPKQNKLVKGPKLMRPDAFSRTKPGIYANELIVVGTSECDLHVYNIPDKKWRLIKKAAWNPEEQFEFKAASV
jgi:N-acetylneuraminic acid mutarotase